jgi:hypothetical protein
VNGAPLFQFDPEAYEATVAGVSTSIAQMSIAAAAMPAELPAGVFGDLSAGGFGNLVEACQAYNQAWASEISSATEALQKMSQLLPVIRADHEAADHMSARRITRDAPGNPTPKTDPPVVIPPKSPRPEAR